MELSYQRRFLPSTSMLVAFDSAARHGSFTAAAEELNLTQGAISRQIRSLEEQLDVQLFRRVNRTVVLTEAGRVYAKDIHSALQKIRTASLSIKTNPRGGVLNVGILPTFGTRWLMPRFPTFLEENPSITVNFVSKLSQFDLQNEGIHAAIHFGLPEWPGADAIFLMNEESVPVASQQFCDEHKISSVKDIAKAPLLHLSSRTGAWQDWFSKFDVEMSEGQSLLFEEFSLVAQAATAGLGAALLPKFLIKNELERKELTILFDEAVPTSSAYYLMIPVECIDYAPVTAFKTWLQKVIDQDE